MALIALSPYTLSHEKSWTYGRFMGLPTWKRRGIGGCLLSPTLVVDFSSVTFRGQRVRRLRGRRWLSCEGGDGSPPSTHRAYCLAAQLHLAMGACCSIPSPYYISSPRLILSKLALDNPWTNELLFLDGWHRELGGDGGAVSFNLSHDTHSEARRSRLKACGTLEYRGLYT